MSDAKETCGIVMPISLIDGLSEVHWTEVKSILSDAAELAGFVPNLVSNADEIGVIQKRIIQNLYENPIVVCDVSGKNPNVMFELGIRLAFDKPTVIVKDDKTAYTFDTSNIEHITYPRDLRFAQVVEFKQKLAEKIAATRKAATDPNYTTFLKHFGAFTVAKIDEREVPGMEFVLEELRSLRKFVEQRDSRVAARTAVEENNLARLTRVEHQVTFEVPPRGLLSPLSALKRVQGLPFVASASLSTDGAYMDVTFATEPSPYMLRHTKAAIDPAPEKPKAKSS